MNNLNIFVSSTCYDLSQIRADLSDFIVNNGHTPILSEYNNFPVNPQLNTIDNCIKNVNENADILLLIVGNRYGSIINSGKSITNTEFLTAKQKGVPIFVFIDKKTLAALGFWKENKDGNFEKFVDTTKIFEFIEDLRNNTQIWTFEFERAQDIIAILKIQLSYLFKESLKIRNIYENQIEDYFKYNLSNQALRILVEKSDFYEYRFFAQTLIDEMLKKEHFKNDFKYDLLFEPKNYIFESSEILNWVIGRMSSLTNIVTSINTLFNVALREFFNEPGKPSDLNGLYYVAKHYSQFYESFIKWKLDINSSFIDDEYKYLKKTLSKLADKVILDTWSFAFEVYDEINKLPERVLMGEKEFTLNLSFMMEFDANDLNNFYQDLSIFRVQMGLPPD